MQLSTSFAVLLAGQVHPTPRLLQQIQGFRVVAADGGMAHAQTLGLQPERWIGDFDSSSVWLQQRYAHIPQDRYPTAKDHTDGQLAVEWALQQGARRLWLLGAMGLETDKTLQHLAMALQLSSLGTEVVLSSGQEYAYPLWPGQHSFALSPGDHLSIVGWSALEGLNLSGVRWPLQGAKVGLGSSLTLSNQALGDVQITLTQGYGVLVVQAATT